MEMPETRLLPSPGCSTWIRLSASISNVRQQAHFAPLGQRTGVAIILVVYELYLPSVQTELPPKPAFRAHALGMPRHSIAQIVEADRHGRSCHINWNGICIRLYRHCK